MDTTITLSDGRRLAYAEWGDPGGKPVFLLHGTPGSRLLCPDAEATEAAGVRLLTVDRPGFGRSDPRPFHSLVDASADLQELSDMLGLGAAGVIGWSGGGPFALAHAFAASDGVVAVGVAGSSLHAESMPEELSGLEGLIEGLRNRDRTAYDEVLQRGRRFADNPLGILEQTLANADDPDRDLMAPRSDAFREYWQEAARQGAHGFAASWTATFGLPWGFSPADLEVPVHIWHGADDVVVPARHSEHLADLIPTARLTVYPGEGHLCPIPHWAEMLRAVTQTER